MHTKWKYKVVRMKMSAFAKVEDKVRMQQDTLDRLGMEGWELINVIYGAADGHPTHYLKRPY